MGWLCQPERRAGRPALLATGRGRGALRSEQAPIFESPGGIGGSASGGPHGPPHHNIRQAMQPNPILYGRDPISSIVAVEISDSQASGSASDDSLSPHGPPHIKVQEAQVYRRLGDHIEKTACPFTPFLLLSEISLLKDWRGDHEVRSLNGHDYYRYLVTVPAWKDLQGLIKHLSKTTRMTSGALDAPFYFLNDPVHQHLLFTGRTLFKEMVFDQLVRLQLDIETYCAPGFEFSNPQREEDRIIVISMTDNRGWERVISGRAGPGVVPEQEMILEMVNEIVQRNPDVIEGHNIFNFDLEYLLARAKRFDIPLKLGRDGSLIRSHPSRIQIAERSITYTKFEVHGRQVVDTWLLAQMYDVSARSLESYGLKEVARYFQVAASDRTYIEPERINWYYEHDLDKLLRYALDDVRETRAISEILCQSFFYQTQIFPFSFQNIIVRGNATKINSLFIREYLATGQSIPKPPIARDFEGGYTDIFRQGVVQNVLYCDIQSLYPSIMLIFDCSPGKDILGIFPLLLKDLTAFRIQAKERARNAASSAEAQYYQALQSTFKILINSFYGYLGFGYGHFADFDQAGKVTHKGRELITGMVQWLGEQGCQVIEIDTDGIYFKPPEGITPDQEEAIIQELSNTLPVGIHLEMAGRYQAMFSYKIKNYALLTEDGRVIIKGSGLRSRGLELFQRRFIEEVISLLLRSQPEKIQALLDQYLDDLTHHRWDKRMFIKTETLQEPPAVYAEKVKAKKRNASAAYELALKSDRRYQAGDQISYYVSGSDKKIRVFEACKLASQWDSLHPDENVEYYKEKLLALYEKLLPFTK